jgi:TonB-linked SusC/RagA family outer membrane protein
VRLSRSVLSAFAILAVVAGNALAQQQAQQDSRGSIIGIVKEAQTSAPLAGVQVRLAGTSLGAMTGADGRFVIANVTPGIYSVDATRIGYSPTRRENVEASAGRPTTVADILMSPNALRLQTIVTSGVSDPTAGVKVPFVVTVLNTDDMPVPALGTTAAMLKGKVSGVSVRPGAGPGAGTQIQLRNPMSVRGDTRPMFIVDGVIMLDFDEDRMTSAEQANANDTNINRGLTPDLEIDPSEIASIEVIKGAAAAALYGSKAANGVISITTNRGASIPQGTARYTLRTEAGISTIGKRVPITFRHNYLMNDQGQYVNTLGQVVATRAERVVDPNGFWDNDYAVPVYDHTDELFTQGRTLNNQVTVGQSTLATNFLVTLGANSETGIIRHEKGQERRNIRLNIDHRAGDRFSLSVGAAYTRTHNNNLTADDEDIFEDIFAINPDVSLLSRGPDGTYLVNPDPDVNTVNPLYFESIWDDTETRGGLQTNLSTNYRVTSFLTLSGQLAYQRVDRSINQIQEPGVRTSLTNISVGRITRTADFNEGMNGNFAAAFVTQWGDLNMRARAQVAGEIAEGRDFSVRSDTANLSAPDADYYRWTRNNGDDRFETRTKSFLVTNALEYRSRYVLEGLYRLDGSSAYGADDPWQPNGRISAAWRMAEEEWWPLASISEAKLRYSIGSATNNPDFDDRFQVFEFGSDNRIQKNAAGNLDLVPETVVEQEMGLDLQILDRFGVELTYARQKSTDLLRATEVLAYSGFDEQVQNVGTIVGNTVEATLEAHWFSSRDFRWSSTLVADRSRAKITAMRREDCPDHIIMWCVGTTFGEINTRHFVQHPGELPAVNRNPESAAMFDVNDEGLLVAVGPNGSWRDQRWGTTMIIDGLTYRWGMPIRMRDDAIANVRVKTQTLPDFNFGFSNNFTYKRLNAFVLLNGQMGGRNMNGTKHSLITQQTHAAIDQAGKPDYQKKPLDYYVASLSGQTVGLGGNTNWVDYFYEDATYAKLDEVLLGYTLPGTMPFMAKLGLERGRLALIGRNLYTFTAYSGYDPEVQGTTGRFDLLSYPRYKTYSAQLEFIF